MLANFKTKKLLNRYRRYIHTEREIKFPSALPSLLLSGSLRTPEHPKTASGMLILPKQGFTNRNGKDILGLDNTEKVFDNQIMSKVNFHTLRYDKRGLGKSIDHNDKNLFLKSGMHELVDDSVQAYRYLAQKSKKLFIFGHSEGAITLPLLLEKIQQQDLPYPKGVIAVSGFGETMATMGRNEEEEQNKILNLLPGFKGWMVRRLINSKKDTQEDLVKKLIKDDRDFYPEDNLPAKWLREHFTFEPEYSEIKCHFLGINGKLDPFAKEESLRDASEKLINAKSVMIHIENSMTHQMRDIAVRLESDSTLQSDLLALKIPIGVEKVVLNWLNKYSTED